MGLVHKMVGLVGITLGVGRIGQRILAGADRIQNSLANW